MNPCPENFLKYDAHSTSDLYLFTENTNDEYLHVTLNNMQNNLQARKYCSLIISPFDWHHQNNNSTDIIQSLTRLVAYQSTTDTILLPKGRHVYRLNLLADHYSALFQSNCDFKLVQEREMWALLQTECLSMEKYVDEMSGIFFNLLQSVGTEEFRVNYQEMYKIILKLFVPAWTQSKHTRNHLWQTFVKEFIESLVKWNDNNGARLIKTLFLFPHFTTPRCYSYAHHKHVAREMCAVYQELRDKKCPCNDDLKIFEDCYVEQVHDYASTAISSWFKRIALENMKKCHVDGSNESKLFIVALRQFYESYFENDKTKIFDLVRSIINQSQIKSVKELSIMYHELKNSVHTLEYNGPVTNIEGDRMSLACTMSLTCHSLVPEPYSIRFTLTSSDQLLQNDINDLNIIPFIKIIDEDNNYPIEHNSIKSNTCLLMGNRNGYTLYAYFWSKQDHPSQSSSMSWNIEISFQKHVAPLHACENNNKNNDITKEQKQKLSACDLINANEMTRIEYRGNYKKYYDKKLCRFYGLLAEDNKDVSLNILFKCSMKNIRVKMSIFTQDEQCVLEKQTINGEFIEIGRKFVKIGTINDAGKKCNSY